MSLRGKIALVTGASRGIGKGIALQLGEAGATVYVTGRPPTDSSSAKDAALPTLQSTADEISARGGKGIAIYVDHGDMNQVKDLFARISEENEGILDILVNNAYAAVQKIADNATKLFFECDPTIWDDINNVGLRNHYFCSVYAARLMVERGTGLIVNISSAGGLSYLFNVAYGVGKCAVDRMAQDMAQELRTKGVTVLSLWPGIVKTELVGKMFENEEVFETFQKAGGSMATVSKSQMQEMFKDGESTEYPGKAVVALASDPSVIRKTGRVLITGDLGDEYGFEDIDGRQPSSIRSISVLLKMTPYGTTLSAYLPRWIKLPGWLMTAVTSKL